MQNMLRTYLSPPVFPEDENKTRAAYYINVIALVSILVLALFFGIRVLSGNSPLEVANLILLALIVALLVVWSVMKTGAVQLAGYIHISTIWVASTLLALGGNGIRGTGFVSYFVVMLLAGLLLGVRPAVAIAVLSILSGFGLAYAETAGVITPLQAPPIEIAVEFTVLFIFSTLFMVLTITSLQKALGNAKANSKDLQASNSELTALRDALELRIKERTAALEKRATQLQTVSSMARSIASTQDLESLLANISDLVSEQFGFYHTGIFLLDSTGQYAVLKAASSEGGKRMLTREHALRLDSNSIVGYVTSRGEPRIALDVGEDSVYFDNPDLPETRSEIALPLRVSGKVIGALDVQSTQTHAYSQDDVFVLSTLADQIAVAIENARLYGEAQSALAASQASFEKYVSQSWNSFVQQARHTGFVFDGKQVAPLDTQIKPEHIRRAIQTGSLSLEKATATLTVPIKLRGQTIGVLDVRSKKGERDWTRDELALLEAAAERAALALENARLVESAQRRASRERAIGDISTKIGAVSNLEYILQTAVEELGRKIGGTAEVTLEIGNIDGQVQEPES